MDMTPSESERKRAESQRLTQEGIAAQRRRAATEDAAKRDELKLKPKANPDQQVVTFKDEA